MAIYVTEDRHGLDNYSIDRLLTEWNRLNEMEQINNNEPSSVIEITRGWIMNELWTRDRIAFGAWAKDEDAHPSKYFG